VARYRFQVPGAVSAPLQLRASLWHRRLRPALVRWVASLSALETGEANASKGA